VVILSMVWDPFGLLELVAVVAILGEAFSVVISDPWDGGGTSTG